MSALNRPQVRAYGDGAILVTFGDRIEVALSRRIGALVAALDGLIAEDRLVGVIDLVPSYTTLTVIFDPGVTDGGEVGDIVLAMWDDLGDDAEGNPGRVVEIPVCYGGEHGPDLDAIAAHTGLPRDEVIARHAAGAYVVGALGFSPGFAFLIGLDPTLATPRRSSPRTVVPPGSVGIGGAQTGVYAQATPGGWSLLGRTPLRLARTDLADPSAAFLLRSGDTVRFVPIDAARFAELAIDNDDDLDADELTSGMPGSKATGAVAALEVLKPGLQTTVQDLGRPQFGRYGISPGGAADRGSLIAANRALGNPDDAAALEITLTGPTVRVIHPVRIALAGADLGATVNGHPLPPGVTIALHPRDILAFNRGPSAGGARAYLAVAGGIDVPLAMGSRATDLTAGMGGIAGRALQVGDLIPVGTADERSDGHAGVGMPGIPGREDAATIVRIVRGPHDDRFDPAAWKAFLHAEFTVSSQSNRMGIRLDGLVIVPTGGADLISEGMVTGAIQVTNGGQPIVMLPARATIGGYATIATVITADLDRLGQAAPGMRIRFREVSIDDARAIARGDFPVETGALALSSALPAVDRDAVLDLVRDFPSFGLASLELDIPTVGVHLRLES